MIVVDVKKPLKDRKDDLGKLAYYMEKDVRQSFFSVFCCFPILISFRIVLTDVLLHVLQVKELPMFKNQETFEPMVGSQKLTMENILVYYVDEVPPTFTMKHLTGGIIAVIVVVVLAVVAGLLVLVSANESTCMSFMFRAAMYRYNYLGFFLITDFLFVCSSLSAGDRVSGTTKLR